MLAHSQDWYTATLDRPEAANSLTAAMVEALHGELDRAEAGGAHTFVIRGAGRHFCGGFDLTDLDTETDQTLAFRFCRIGLLLQRLYEAPFRTVAVVQGAAVGAGADIALACDVRLGTPATTMRFPGLGFGVVLGTARLAAIAGASVALDVVAAGTRVDAESCLRHGLLTSVVAPEELDDSVAQVGAADARIPAESLASAARAARPPIPGGGLAELVRSVARPGLRAAVTEYAGAQRNSKR